MLGPWEVHGNETEKLEADKKCASLLQGGSGREESINGL